MSTATQQVVAKAWNFAHVLRDDLQTALEQFFAIAAELKQRAT